MIVLCPKTFAGKENHLEREFLMAYLVEKRKKACVANEVWDAFKFRVKKSNPSSYENIITNTRGCFEPVC